MSQKHGVQSTAVTSKIYRCVALKLKEYNYLSDKKCCPFK